MTAQPGCPYVATVPSLGRVPLDGTASIADSVTPARGISVAQATGRRAIRAASSTKRSDGIAEEACTSEKHCSVALSGSVRRHWETCSATFPKTRQ